MTKTFTFDSVDSVNALTPEQVLEIAESFTSYPSYDIVINPPGKEEYEKEFAEHVKKAQKIDNEYQKIAFEFRDRILGVLSKTSDEDSASDTLAETMQGLIYGMINPDDGLTYTDYDYGDRHPDSYWIPSTC